ncbi:MAG TPA: APC family permease, partial [Dehalococcoidia bacterium]|nr:APC family permease [Dehalococcoidia bacterium]
AMLWLAFVLAALLATLTGLSYAELAAMFPSAGAEYEYIRRASNEFLGFLTGWMMIAANLIAAGAVALGFAFYLRYFFDVPTRVGAIGLLAFLSLVVAAGIQRSIWLTIALAALQVGGLIFVVVSGAPNLGDHSLTEGGTAGGVLAGSALVFFAFIGFDEVVTLAEETHDPSRTVPRALLLALGISGGLYVLTGIAAISLVGADALAASPTPLADAIASQWGTRGADVVAVIALASTMNTSLLVLTTASRLIYGMARNAALPPVFARVGRAHSPYMAAAAGFVVSASFATFGDIGLVASVTDFGVYVIFIAVNAALVALRFAMPDAARPFRVPLSIGRVPLIPLAGTATVIVMLTFLDPWAWLLGTGAIALGAAAWVLSTNARARARNER